MTRVELRGRDSGVGKALRMDHQFIVPRVEIDEFKRLPMLSALAVRCVWPSRFVSMI